MLHDLHFKRAVNLEIIRVCIVTIHSLNGKKSKYLKMVFSVFKNSKNRNFNKYTMERLDEDDNV